MRLTTVDQRWFSACPSHSRRAELEHYFCTGGDRIRALICIPDDKRNLALYAKERWDFFFLFLNEVTSRYHKGFFQFTNPICPRRPQITHDLHVLWNLSHSRKPCVG